MHHCGVSEPLEIGANGFPVPNQLSVWGSVPYPDQTNNQTTGKGKGKGGKGAKGKVAGKAKSNATATGN